MSRHLQSFTTTLTRSLFVITYIIIANYVNRKCISQLSHRVTCSIIRSDHQQAMADRTSLSSMLAKSQNVLPARSMKDSRLEVHLPLGSEPHLREKYLTFHNTVRYIHTSMTRPRGTPSGSETKVLLSFRFGRILEDLDSLAGITGCFTFHSGINHIWSPTLMCCLSPQSSSLTLTPTTRN